MGIIDAMQALSQFRVIVQKLCGVAIVEMTPGQGSNKDVVADHVCAHTTKDAARSERDHPLQMRTELVV